MANKNQAAPRIIGLPYNKLISGLKKSNIALDRKILAQLVKHHSNVFSKIVDSIKK